MTAADSLAAQLDAIAAAIEQARAFEHEHGLSSSRTRKLPANAIRELRRWRHATEHAEQRATVPSTAPQPRHRDNGQPTAGSNTQPAKEPAVPASPTVGVRIPVDLRQRAEDQARREDRSFSQVVRHALAAHLSDADREPSKHTERAA